MLFITLFSICQYALKVLLLMRWYKFFSSIFFCLQNLLIIVVLTTSFFCNILSNVSYTSSHNPFSTIPLTITVHDQCSCKGIAWKNSLVHLIPPSIPAYPLTNSVYDTMLRLTNSSNSLHQLHASFACLNLTSPKIMTLYNVVFFFGVAVK